MKKIINTRRWFVLAIGLAFNIPVSAQLQYIPAAVQPFSLSLGGGVTNLYGDIQKKIYMPAIRGNFDYNITPYISIGVEGQYGQFAEGYKNGRAEGGPEYSQSNYYTGNVNMRFGLGQALIVKNNFTQFISGFYIGGGVGWINSEVQKILYTLPANTSADGIIILKDQEMIIPLNIGLNEDLPVYKLGINLNFQYNLTNGEALDGFNYPVSRNLNKDAYSLLSLVVRYYFGRGN